MTREGTSAIRVALAGAFDTKGEEYAFVRDRLALHGVGSVMIDTGVLGAPNIPVDVDRTTVASAGGVRIEQLVAAHDRNSSVQAMGRGAARLISDMSDGGIIAGVMVLGGSNAGVVMSTIAAALPIGVPKLLVSTIVAGDTRPYVGASDLTMMYPVVDIAGLNSISVPVLSRAADALAGLVTGPPVPGVRAGVETIACTMFGVTTACVTTVRESLERDGDEVHVFHATGTGGMSMEAMIRSGLFTAVADITTTELADNLVGGVCDAGATRLDAAAERGIPQVISTGALDMVNFGAPDTVPTRFRGRELYQHNSAVTLMRTDAEENSELGRRMAAKLNRARGPVEVLVPRRGFSQLSVEGGPFHDPHADAALIDALVANLDPRIPVRVHDLTINDPAFAAGVIEALGRVLGRRKGNRE